MLLNLENPQRPGTSGTTAQIFVDQTSISSVRLAAVALGGPAFKQAASPADIVVEQLHGGITNALFRVTASCGTSVLVRVFGHATEIVIDREADAAAFAALGELGFGPRLIGSFANGRIEEFLCDVRPLEPVEMRQRAPRDFLRGIARAVAHLHGLAMPGRDAGPVLWARLTKWSQLALDAVTDNTAQSTRPRPMPSTIERAVAGIAWCEQVLPSSRNSHGASLLDAQATALNGSAPQVYESMVAHLVAPLTVPRSASRIVQARLDGMALMYATTFCHYDLLSGNVLVPAETAQSGDEVPTVRLIDYEYSGYGYAGVDIANHFVEVAGFSYNLATDYPPRQDRLAWLASYAEARGAPHEIWDITRGGATAEAALHEMLHIVDSAIVASDLHWGLWACIQARHSPIDFDYTSYAVKRLEGFLVHQQVEFQTSAARGEIK